MKIAIIRTDCSSQDIDSYNSQELGLALGLASLGHCVDIFLGSKERANCTVVSKHDSRIIIHYIDYYLIPVLGEPYYNVHLKKSLRENKYDFVQINEEGNFSSYLVTRLCESLGIPFLFYQGMYKVLSGRKWALYERLHASLLRPRMQKDTIIAFCKTTRAKHFLEERAYPRCSVLPVGLDFSAFCGAENRDWRRELGIGSKRGIVLYVGSIESRRHPEFILELAERCRDRLDFILVGEGPEFNTVEQRIRCNGLSNVHLLGRLQQKHLPSLYRQSNVLVLPSDYEIYGMVVIEALYFGLPVVATATAGPEDILKEPRLGEALSGLSLQEWDEAVTRYCLVTSEADKEYRSAYASREFDWQRIAREYMGKVEELISSQKKSAADTE